MTLPLEKEAWEERRNDVRAILGAAGHEITDPVLNAYADQHARGEISSDEARALGYEHVFGRLSSKRK